MRVLLKYFFLIVDLVYNWVFVLNKSIFMKRNFFSIELEIHFFNF